MSKAVPPNFNEIEEPKLKLEQQTFLQQINLICTKLDSEKKCTGHTHTHLWVLIGILHSI